MPSLDACKQISVPTSLGSVETVAAGCACYSVYVVLNTLSSTPFLPPVGRTGSSIIALSLMVATLVISPDLVYAAIGCNFPLLLIVAATMILSQLLVARANVGAVMIWVATKGHDSPRLALVVLMMLTSCFTAFVGWDSASIAMAEPVLQLCESRRWPVKPFVIGVAAACNIGSTLSPVSNPGNILVVLDSQSFGSEISFAYFCAILAAPWVAASLVMTPACIVTWFWRSLGEGRARQQSDVDFQLVRCACNGEDESVSALENGRPRRIRSAGGSSYINTTSTRTTTTATMHTIGPTATTRISTPSPPICTTCPEALKSSGVILAFIGTIIFWFLDFELGIVGVVGACAAMIACWEPVHGLYERCFDGPTFLYILFVIPTVTAFILTGVPSAFFNFVSPYLSTSRENPAGVTVLVLVVAVFVQLMSNVPAVFILGEDVAKLAVSEGLSSTQGYLVTAFCTATSGTLTITGSISQKILYDHASRTTKGRVEVGFFDHFFPNVGVAALSLLVGVSILLAELQ